MTTNTRVEAIGEFGKSQARAADTEVAMLKRDIRKLTAVAAQMREALGSALALIEGELSCDSCTNVEIEKAIAAYDALEGE